MDEINVKIEAATAERNKVNTKTKEGKRKYAALSNKISKLRKKLKNKNVLTSTPQVVAPSVEAPAKKVTKKITKKAVKKVSVAPVPAVEVKANEELPYMLTIIGEAIDKGRTVVAKKLLKLAQDSLSR